MVVLIAAALFAACAAPPVATSPLPSARPPPTATPPSPTPTDVPVTSTPASTPPPLVRFSSPVLRPEVQPHSYMDDPCEYLRLRWDPDRSPPGTVVVPIMFHSVREPDNMIQDAVTISTEYLASIVERARALGFETVTAEEVAGFLEENRRIPPRSMIFIVDDRRPGTVEQYFLPLAVANDWTVSLGWIVADTRADLWAWMERMNETGRLDIQSHGYWHKYITPDMPERVVREEIVDPIPVLEEHFGKRPTAFVWPGGNFTETSVKIAREAGYRLGFTAFSRGPLLFDWIPLGEEEAEIGDPVMVLPRYWSTAAWVNIEQAARLAEEAEAFAAERFPQEAAWFRQVCGGDLPPPSGA
ncbi:MAG TPA: polysaccharide deacetylase family protein [Anaerolineales bacterium]|nr:polysaccharide deacetylase family protein [Anaerolineales bacterium]